MVVNRLSGTHEVAFDRKFSETKAGRFVRYKDGVNGTTVVACPQKEV